MKRKRPAAPVPAAVVEQAMPPEALKAEGLSPVDMGKIVLFSLLLFFAVTLQTGAMAMVLVVLALLSFIGRKPFRLVGQRLCVPVIGLLCFMVLVGLAAVYSHFGGYAVKEFYKFLASFSVALILLARFEKKHVRGLLWGFAAVCAVISLLCIDAASASGLYHVFTSLMEALGSSSYANVQQDAWGTRVAGIYNDANLSASLLALGSLVSLHLASSEDCRWKKGLACFLLGVSAQGFFLSLSRGAILCFAVALVVYLAAVGKGRRLPLFFLMFFSAVVTLVGSMLAIPGILEGSLLPDLVALLSGVVIFLLDWAVGARLARALVGRGKVIAIVAAALAVVCVGYAVAALTVTGPYTFTSTGYLGRTVALAPGDYTLSGQWDGEVQVRVLFQTQRDVINSTGTTLYQGPAEGTAFTVPQEEGQLSLQFRGEPGVRVEEAVLSDGTEVSLGYPLLPSFVANRLQENLFTSVSFVLRVQYLKDGWTLFAQSPLIGHGLGCTEGLLTSVQPFYYESLYLHNHLLQVMNETGLVGLVCFLMLLVGSLLLIWKGLRKEKDPTAAMLLACWVMMNTHSLMEINFSIRMYQCVALLLLLLPVLLYAEPLPLKSAKATSVAGVTLAVLLWLTLAVSGGVMEAHRMVLREMETFSTTSVSEFMDTTRKFVSRDLLDHEQNQLNFVANAVKLDDSRYNGPMRKYAEELRASGTYTACSGLARYYYLPRSEWEELFDCSREGIAQEASTGDSWNLQVNFYRTDVLSAITEEDMDVYLDGVLETRAYLESYNQGRMEEIKLTEENQAFLDTVSSLREQNISGKAAYALLTSLSGQ